MKKQLMAALLAAAVASPLALLHADDKKMTVKERQEHVQKKVEKMAKELHLSADQQTKVRGILERKMQRKQEIMEEADRDIRGTLTAAQLSKYDEMKN